MGYTAVDEIAEMHVQDRGLEHLSGFLLPHLELYDTEVDLTPRLIPRGLVVGKVGGIHPA